MSELVTLGRPARAAPSLPHTVVLPTRYYARAALAETARAFSEAAAVEVRAGDGILEVTFTRLADEPDVVDEFLNHALYASAAAGPEVTR